MELLKKYPKTFQWLFLLVVFFALCFAIEVPETYKFIRGQAEFVKDPNQSSYVFLGKEVRYYAFDVFWRLPPLLGWLPIWICLLYTSPSPRDYAASRMPSSA